MNLCDIETIRAVLGRHGFHFSKSLGQNFLTDESVPRRIAERSGAAEAKNVVEVGPGMGCLTAELCRRAGKVVAVELDRALLPVLDETLAEFDNFEVVQGDVLALDLAALCREKFGDGRARSRAPICRITSPHPRLPRCLRATRLSALRLWCRKRSRSVSAPRRARRRIPRFPSMCSIMRRRRLCLTSRRIALCRVRKWIPRYCSSRRWTARRSKDYYYQNFCMKIT